MGGRHRTPPGGRVGVICRSRFPGCCRTQPFPAERFPRDRNFSSALERSRPVLRRVLRASDITSAGASNAQAVGMLGGMHLPEPRGPLSEALCRDLASGSELSAAALDTAGRVASSTAGALTDEDLQISLAVCYELHYRGFDGVGDGWEWEPSLLRLRAVLETAHLAALRELVGPVAGHRRADRPPARRADRRRRRTVAVDLHGQARHARAVAGVPDPALGLPPQGGRPAHLRRPPAQRPDEVGDGRDPGRRVRRRHGRAHAQRAVRRADARPRPRRRPTARSGTTPRRRPSRR